MVQHNHLLKGKLSYLSDPLKIPSFPEKGCSQSYASKLKILTHPEEQNPQRKLNLKSVCVNPVLLY